MHDDQGYQELERLADISHTLVNGKGNWESTNWANTDSDTSQKQKKINKVR